MIVTAAVAAFLCRPLCSPFAMSSSSDRDLLQLDLYHLLDPSDSLSSSSPATDISRHYRKQARLLHPDKNPNNPNAAAQFDTLQRVYELLSDGTRRADYDERRRRREEKKRKAASEDVKVRLMRERLEERERQGKAGWEANKRQMQAARIQRENEAVIQQLRQTTQPAQPQPQSQQAAARRQAETRWEEQKQAEADGGRHGDRRGEASVEARGTGPSAAALDMRAYEMSTLERMREMARRKREEKEKQTQQQTVGTNERTAKTAAQATPQQEIEVIVLDDERSAVT